MKPPEITPEARREIAAAVAVLARHGVKSCNGNGLAVIPLHGQTWTVTPQDGGFGTKMFRPFTLRGPEIAAADKAAGNADYEAWANS